MIINDCVTGLCISYSIPFSIILECIPSTYKKLLCETECHVSQAAASHVLHLPLLLIVSFSLCLILPGVALDSNILYRLVAQDQ